MRQRLLEVEGPWEANGSPLIKHFRPSQDEHFEVLEGTLQTRIDGVERSQRAGDTFQVPRGAMHQVWNSADQPARAIWRTTPTGRAADCSKTWRRSAAAPARWPSASTPPSTATSFAWPARSRCWAPSSRCSARSGGCAATG